MAEYGVLGHVTGRREPDFTRKLALMQAMQSRRGPSRARAGGGEGMLNNLLTRVARDRYARQMLDERLRSSVAGRENIEMETRLAPQRLAFAQDAAVTEQDYLNRKLRQEFGLAQEGMDLREGELGLARQTQAFAQGPAHQAALEQAARERAFQDAQMEHQQWERTTKFKTEQEDAAEERRLRREIAGLQYGARSKRDLKEELEVITALEGAETDPNKKAELRATRIDLTGELLGKGSVAYKELVGQESRADAQGIAMLADELDVAELQPVFVAGAKNAVHYMRQILKHRAGIKSPTKEQVSAFFVRLMAREDVREALRSFTVPGNRARSGWGTKLDIGAGMGTRGETDEELERRLMEEFLPSVLRRMG